MEDRNQQFFEQAKQEAEAVYKSIGAVVCPYLKKKVAFNAKGLEHIKFGKPITNLLDK